MSKKHSEGICYPKKTEDEEEKEEATHLIVKNLSNFQEFNYKKMDKDFINYYSFLCLNFFFIILMYLL